MKPPILFVNDSQLDREQVVSLLSSELTVVAATDTASALRALAGRAFDAVVLDLEMGHENGRAVHQYIESIAPRLAKRVVVFGSGARDPELETWAHSFASRYVRREDVFGLLDCLREVVKPEPSDVEG